MSKRMPDIRKLAARQRWLLWLMLIALIAQLAPLFVGRGQYGMIVAIGLVILQLVALVLLFVGVILLLTAQGNHPLMVVVCAFLMLAPCANLLLLVLVNMSVTRTLRRAGLRVGFMGVDPDDVERLLDPGLCTGCAYNLTGNVSGVCPECGQPIAPPDASTEA